MKETASEKLCDPLVSVIIPAYNSACYIRQTVRSVQAQSLKDWELLVIDDASCDETARIVLDMAREDPRIRLLTNSANMGTARSRNYGVQNSKGTYVAFLDSDDLWRPDKLRRQTELLETGKADVVYCTYGYMDEDGRNDPNAFRVPQQTDLEQMLKENVVGCSTVMLPRELALQYPFTKQFYFEDYVLWLSLLKAGKRFYGITDVMVDYRIRKNSRGSNKLRCAGYRWHVYRSFMEFSPVKSLYYLLQYGFSGVLKHAEIVFKG